MSFVDSVTDTHLYKELGEIPYYMHKLYGYDSYIDDYSGTLFDSDNEFRGVHLIKYTKSSKFIPLKKIIRIFKYAKKIDLLYLLQITPDTLFKMLAYRLGGGRGKIYLKLDLGIYAKDGKDLLKWENMSLFLKTVHFLFKQLPDVYTVETKRSYERLRHSYYSDLIENGKLFRLPNGFDSELLDEIGITRRKVSEKEKVMITVGRLGAYEKNTELLLDILSKLDLKDWTFYLIGPIEDHFQVVIDSFYKENPSKKKNVIFTGPIYDKKELFEYYDKSRVFALTSRHEGFAFALVEAAYMKNYIVSTDVGGAEDVLDYTGGVLSSSELVSDKFVGEIQQIIWSSCDELNNLVFDDGREEMTWETLLQNNSGIQKLIN